MGASFPIIPLGHQGHNSGHTCGHPDVTSIAILDCWRKAALAGALFPCGRLTALRSEQPSGKSTPTSLSRREGEKREEEKNEEEHGEREGGRGMD